MTIGVVHRSDTETSTGAAAGGRVGPCLRVRPFLVLAGLAALLAACTPRSPDTPAPAAPPERLWSPSLAYPPEMFLNGIEGEVMLQGVVDATGRVDSASVRVLRATNPAFEPPAIAMLLGTRFRPAEREGAPIEALIEVPISFELANVEIDSAAAADELLRAERLIRRGRVDDALSWFTAAQKSDPRVAASPSFWFPLCWYGTLWDRAADVLSACDELVALAPYDAAARRARGMAKAVTGDYPGAITDFQAALRGRIDAGSSRTLRDWIGELQADRNPVTARVLESLRAAGSTTGPVS
jgi:TonB family protein